MQYSILGSTGLRVSRLAFGAGPVAATMTGQDSHAQQQLLQHVLDAGINWIDTAAGYGNGQSETNLGTALSACGRDTHVHLATKVRLTPADLENLEANVHTSVAASLERLGADHVTLLQLHNSITARRGDEPTSITPHDLLKRNGVLHAFRQLQRRGLVRFVGLTAIGQPGPLRDAIRSSEFQTIQVPYNLTNPSAGQTVPTGFPEANYENIIEEAHRHDMGVLAIRVYAGGALVGNPPSRHTLSTQFFPLDLYQRDQVRVQKLREKLPDSLDTKQAAVRFVLSHPSISSAIIGFGEPAHVDEAAAHAAAGPLPADVLQLLGQ